MLGSKYHEKLFKICDPESIPTFYGGKCELSLIEADSKQPWFDYELVDEPGSGPDQVGVRHKKTGELFTPTMALALKNPQIMGPGLSGS